MSLFDELVSPADVKGVAALLVRRLRYLITTVDSRLTWLWSPSNPQARKYSEAVVMISSGHLERVCFLFTPHAL